MEKQSSKFRQISKGKYIMAGILTFLIFSLGLTMGIILEEMRYNEAQEINEEQDVNYISLQLQYLMLTSFEDQSNCPVLLTTLQDTIDDLSGSLSKIIDYEKENSISSDDYQLISRRYTLDNLRYWLMAEKAKESCDLDMVSILYFYSDDCPSCPNQGTVLSYFKKLMGDQLLVFPINLDLREDEAMIEIMMSLYNVTKYPTIIIEGEKYEGVTKKNDLQEIICANLENSDACDVQLDNSDVLENLNNDEGNLEENEYESRT